MFDDCMSLPHLNLTSFDTSKVTDMAFMFTSCNSLTSLDLSKNTLLDASQVNLTGNRYTLVERDRLQAGLSYATLVIQTSLRGGTMHAVNATLKAQKPLFMIRYKNMDGQIGGKAEGNKKFLEEGKAHALTSGSFEEALAIIRKSVEKINKPKIKDSLF